MQSFHPSEEISLETVVKKRKKSEITDATVFGKFKLSQLELIESARCEYARDKQLQIGFPWEPENPKTAEMIRAVMKCKPEFLYHEAHDFIYDYFTMNSDIVTLMIECLQDEWNEYIAEQLDTNQRIFGGVNTLNCLAHLAQRIFFDVDEVSAKKWVYVYCMIPGALPFSEFLDHL